MRSAGIHTVIVVLAALTLAACATTPAPQHPVVAGGISGPAPQGPVLAGGIFGPALSPADMDRAIAAAAAFPLGSKQNPVRVHMPPGERAYLKRLRCSNGRSPGFGRRGSIGTGPFGNPLDLYSVRCRNGTPASSTVYMDMYHGAYVENRPVPGFSIKPAR